MRGPVWRDRGRQSGGRRVRCFLPSGGRRVRCFLPRRRRRLMAGADLRDLRDLREPARNLGATWAHLGAICAHLGGGGAERGEPVGPVRTVAVRVRALPPLLRPLLRLAPERTPRGDLLVRARARARASMRARARVRMRVRVRARASIRVRATGLGPRGDLLSGQLPISPLHLPYISPRRSAAYISPPSALYLASAVSCLYLPYICPISRLGGQLPERGCFLRGGCLVSCLVSCLGRQRGRVDGGGDGRRPEAGCRLGAKGARRFRRHLRARLLRGGSAVTPPRRGRRNQSAATSPNRWRVNTGWRRRLGRRRRGDRCLRLGIGAGRLRGWGRC